MKPTTESQVQTFTLPLQLAEDRERGLPKATAEFSVLMERTAKGLRHSIQLAYLRFPGRPEAVVASRNFDDAVTLDFGRDGRLIGVELLALRAPKQFPEYRRFVKDQAAHAEANLYMLAPATLVETWSLARALVDTAVKARERTLHLLDAEGPRSVHVSIDELSIRGLVEALEVSPDQRSEWAARESRFARQLVKA